MRSLAIVSLLLLPAQDDATEKRLEVLAGKDWRAAGAASDELQRSAGPELFPEVLRLFKTAEPQASTPVTRLLECLAGPDLVPELLELLAKEPRRLASIASVLEKLADPRAEAALLPFLKAEAKNDSWAVLSPLGVCGGKDSIAAIRKFRADVGDPRLEEHALRRLVDLRDPAVSRDILEACNAGKIELRHWKGDLARLGGRSILPDLVALVRDPKTKIEPRKAALELVGILGGADDVPFLVEHLGDPRFAEGAAAGLEARADPRAAAPLATALQRATWAGPFARAFAAAPSAEAEGPLLEILDDRAAYPRTFETAVLLSVRVATPKLKAKLVALLLEGIGRELTLAVAPLVGPADLDRVREAAGKGGEAGFDATLVLALRGDADALRRTVGHVAERRVQDRIVRVRDRLNSQAERNALEVFSPPPPGLLAIVEEEFGRKPEWTGGAEFLALHGKDAGRKHLIEELKESSDRERERLNRALLALGERSVVAALLKSYESYRENKGEERQLARLMTDADAAKVREVLRAGTLKYPWGLLRLLAYRDDREAIPHFRREARSASSGAYPIGPLFEALARMKDAETAHVHRRKLRDLVAERRAHAARCLGLLGDRAAVRDLAPLLGDLQPERMAGSEDDPFERIPRVCDAAAEAVAALLGLTLEGTPDERVKAAAEAAAR